MFKLERVMTENTGTEVCTQIIAPAKVRMELTDVMSVESMDPLPIQCNDDITFRVRFADRVAGQIMTAATRYMARRGDGHIVWIGSPPRELDLVFRCRTTVIKVGQLVTMVQRVFYALTADFIK